MLIDLRVTCRARPSRTKPPTRGTLHCEKRGPSSRAIIRANASKSSSFRPIGLYFGVRWLDTAFLRSGLTRRRNKARQAGPRESGVKPPHSKVCPSWLYNRHHSGLFRCVCPVPQLTNLTEVSIITINVAKRQTTLKGGACFQQKRSVRMCLCWGRFGSRQRADRSKATSLRRKLWRSGSRRRI